MATADPSGAVGSDRVPMSVPEPKLVCRGVWKIFGHRADETLRAMGPDPSYEALTAAGLVPAVRNVDIEVGEGEIFVIMGLSGSGKSTLVRCLSRLVEPTAGEILFQGQNLLAASNSEMIELRRHAMGMVFQHFALLPHMTVADNVAFPLEVQGVSRTERTERAARMIDLVGLAGREAAFPRELSGGQQQRVGIARSLASDPELWFLDEPFSALDPLIRREMQDEFMRLQSVLKKTIVFITHDFDEAIRLADRIAIMKSGVVEQVGSPEDIVLNPATDYVREFTGAVSRAKVVKVTSLMGPVNDATPTKMVQENRSVADAAPLFNDGTECVAVTDAQGRVTGHLARPTVVDMMLQG